MAEDSLPNEDQQNQVPEEALDQQNVPESQDDSVDAASVESGSASAVGVSEAEEGASADPQEVESPADGSEDAVDGSDQVSGDMSEEEAEQKMMAELDSMDESDPDDEFGLGNADGSSGPKESDEALEARGAEFQQLAAGRPSGSSRNLDLLMDVVLPISIELGSTRMSIQDILNLGPGSVVELNKLAGEPVDLLVNNKVVAKGEVVVIDENFGLRVTSLISPEERLKSLGE